MGGMASGPEQVQETKEMQAQAQLAQEQWNRFVEVGIPVQNEAIARMTGIRIDNETGEATIDSGGFSPLDKDGNIVTDGADSRIAMEKQATADLYQNHDPNQSSLQSKQTQDHFAQAGVASDMNQQLGQQTGYLQNVNNVAAMGQGEKISVANDSMQLAADAQNEAINAAGQAQALRQSNSNLAGMALGAGTSGFLRHTDMNKSRSGLANQIAGKPGQRNYIPEGL